MTFIGSLETFKEFRLDWRVSFVTIYLSFSKIPRWYVYVHVRWIWMCLPSLFDSHCIVVFLIQCVILSIHPPFIHVIDIICIFFWKSTKIWGHNSYKISSKWCGKNFSFLLKFFQHEKLTQSVKIFKKSK